MISDHEQYMELALIEAQKAEQREEVPIGAVLVSQTGDVIANAHNQTITKTDPTAHAEIIALRRGAQKLGNYRLLNTSLYVTVEPCIMCMGAIIHARVSEVIFAAPDPKWGGAGSLYDFSVDLRLNHGTQIISGVCCNQSKQLIQNFFRSKRGH